jgi:hypothetical protein
MHTVMELTSMTSIVIYSEIPHANTSRCSHTCSLSWQLSLPLVMGVSYYVQGFNWMMSHIACMHAADAIINGKR